MTTPPEGVGSFWISVPTWVTSGLNPLTSQARDRKPTVDVTSEMGWRLRQSSSPPAAPAAVVVALRCPPTSPRCRAGSRSPSYPMPQIPCSWTRAIPSVLEDAADSSFSGSCPGGGAGEGARPQSFAKAAVRAVKDTGGAKTKGKQRARWARRGWPLPVVVVVAAVAAYGWSSWAPAPVDTIIHGAEAPVQTLREVASQPIAVAPASEPAPAASEPVIGGAPAPAFVPSEGPACRSKAPTRSSRVEQRLPKSRLRRCPVDAGDRTRAPTAPPPPLVPTPAPRPPRRCVKTPVC